MQKLLVITALGEDRPGIVNELARVVSEAGCNIEDSRMTVLGGEFAVILLVKGKWNELAKLETNLPGLGRKLGLMVSSKRTECPRRQGDLLPYAVEVVAVDHPGIVQQLANFFSQRKINIRDMSTASYAAAHTGTAMFSVQMSVDVPAGMHIAALREEFMDFCDQLNLDAIIEPIKG
ncbi:glycine cleavage system protein R [Alkalilimnicola sp. S0819]|uniref:glycine cleavage system protein R n=1 Tax=Alkalilimnicola sp. S0819 TaxID=2613922 RepID=UPI0012624886|nr:glycine cleavage system protein R [Alkalilimnicola sp. S0819]KAB7628309.1 glycine cleavage system protein R [Alkalilimnicola sp. S0819]MPQ15207.1 glycine cleavage system protein R [Alkalilimnicola sp. S0819]